MASLKDLRNRIASVAATQKITKALNMVAAAKLRRSREAAENARPYAERMAAVIANLAQGVSAAGAPPLLVGTGRDGKELVVVATADRGLAGGFNSSIVRAAREHIASRVAAGKQVSILTVGRKARDQLRRLYGDRFVGNLEVGPAATLAVAHQVADIVLKRFADGEADVVTLFFNHFVSVVTQKPTARQLIPAQVAGSAPTIDLKGAVYEYEPDEETILATLLPRNIVTQIFAAMLENQAGFFAAQMAAMDNATRNAGDMIAALTLIKNRTRQAQITKELIEIISGAEAL
ncbi:MAG TPA: F0F1 ATP synthase subunit gamma [Caulobacteraceae bacterium]|jgi:F-type H+-transporting ATPase subunit gamma|nr:F0F1 ATP synthase subunit gamma [Caulobacteraceae bacterium]